jgi:regulator of sigma E protease
MTLDGILFWLLAVPLLLLILVPLVLVHEFGHFLTARLAGIRVLEFGIGFPPKARVIGHDHETEYTLNWLPIGGFVRLEGEEAESDDPRAFSNASLPKQLIVLAAGVTMNLLTAVFLMFVVAWVFNPIVEPQVAGYSGDPSSGQGGYGTLTPAQAAGIGVGDRLVSIDGKSFSLLDFTSNPLDPWSAELHSHAGQKVTLVVLDPSGQERTVDVTLRVPAGNEGALGVSYGFTIGDSQGNPVSAAGQAVSGTVKALGLIVVGLGDIGSQIATNPTQAPPGVVGPVGIAEDVGTVATQDNGPMLLLLLAAVLSANLALVNFLPFPPLDGGKAAVMIVKKAFGKKAVSALETATYLVGFALLLTFIAWISFFDIIRAGSGQ